MSVSIGLLGVSLLALMTGALVERYGVRSPTWRGALDGFTLAIILGLCVTHLMPEALAMPGLWALGALGALGAGVALPLWMERRLGRAARAGGVYVVLVGLALHAALESAALGAARAHAALPLGLAIALHRAPMGVLIHGLMRQTRGLTEAALAVAALMVASVVGFGAGAGLSQWLSPEASGLLHAFISGSLLHVVVAHHLPDAQASVGSCGHEHHASHGSHASHASHAPKRLALKPTSSPSVKLSVKPAPSSGAPAVAFKGVIKAPVTQSCGAGCGHPEHVHVHSEPQAVRASALGALAGLLALGALAQLPGVHEHASASQMMLRTFWSFALESAPALVLAYALAGVIQALVTPARLAWLGRGSALSQSARGVLFGLPLPICSCGVLPLYESLVRRGVPATAAMGFLIATPELGLDALLISVPLLGQDLALARLLAAAIVALGVAWLIGGRLAAQATPAAAALQAQEPEAQDAPPAAPLAQRLRRGLSYGYGELFDHTMPWVIMGLGIAALCQPLLATGLGAQLAPWLQVPLLALLGIPMYVCASGATPIAAVAIHYGVSPGAALAFLLAGPATNMTTFGVLSALHGRRIALGFGLAVFAGALIMGWGVDLWGVQGVSHAHEHAHGHQAHVGPLTWASMIALGVACVASLLRQGPRGLLRQITEPVHAH